MRSLAPNLYVAELPFRLGGVEIGARMTVVQLPEGLWIHSPIDLAPFKAEIDALGPVRYIVAPNKYHYLSLEEWSRAYPEALIYAAPGIKPFKNVHIHRTLDDAPVPEWQPHLEYVLLHGSKIATEAIFFHPASRTLIITDTVQNIPPDRDFFTRLLGRILGTLNRFAPSRFYKLALRDKPAARDSLEKIYSWDFDRMIIAHGQIKESGAKAALRDAYQFVLK
jgi:hypothetical protein